MQPEKIMSAMTSEIGESEIRELAQAIPQVHTVITDKSAFGYGGHSILFKKDGRNGKCAERRWVWVRFKLWEMHTNHSSHRLLRVWAICWLVVLNQICCLQLAEPFLRPTVVSDVFGYDLCYSISRTTIEKACLTLGHGLQTYRISKYWKPVAENVFQHQIRKYFKFYVFLRSLRTC